MKVNKFALLTLSFGTLIIGMTGPSWAGEAGDESAQGAASIGAGALTLISAPLIVVAGATTGDSEMVGAGLSAPVVASAAVMSGVETLTVGTVQAAGSMAKEIVHIVHASGENLMELDAKAFNMASGEYSSNTPTAHATINNQPKAIPLVVRKQYVEMNEKVAQ